MRKIFHRFFTIVLVVGSILLLTNFVWACSCITLPLDMTIDGAENIVILELKSVEKFKKGERIVGDDEIKQSKLVVKKVFKGKLKVGQELTFRQGVCCICVWGFNEKSIGTDYLFFLDSNAYQDGLWEGYICSRSGSLKSVGADLLYLEKLKKVKGKTRLSGTVYRTKDRWNAASYETMAGIQIRIIGKGVDISLTTDQNGVYEVYNLPVGKYRLIPEKIIGLGLNDSDSKFEIEIKAKGLEEQNIEYLVEK